MSLDLLCIAGTDGYFQKVNPSWVKTLGFSEEELLAQPFIEFVHPADVEMTLKEARRFSEVEGFQSVHFENRYRTKNGNWVWLNWTATMEEDRIYCVARDVTRWKKDRLVLEDLQKAADIGAWVIDLPLLQMNWTSQTYRIFDLPQGESVDWDFAVRFFKSGHSDKARALVEECINGLKKFDEELLLMSQSGVAKWVRFTGHAIDIVDGRPQKVTGTLQDITEKMSDRMELQDRKVMLERIVKNNPGMVYQFVMTAQKDMYFKYCSPQGFDIFDITPEQLDADPAVILSLVHPDEKAALNDKILQSAEAMKRFEWRGRVVTPKGSLKWIKASSDPRKGTNGSVFWDGIILDVTDEVEREEELNRQIRIVQHNAKLASIGELAAGVGHEINNPLTIANGNIDILRKKLAAAGCMTDEIQFHFSNYLNAADRIEQIVDGLRTFSRVDSQELLETDIVHAANQTLSLITEIYEKDNIKLLKKIELEPVYVRGNLGRLQQAFMNLLSNAKDATEGQIDRKMSFELREENEDVVVIVGDNGEGVDPAIREKIFDSFFTTKKVGKGTGIGLSMVQAIVQAHHGQVELGQSEWGGAQFVLRIPKLFSSTEKGGESLNANTSQDNEMTQIRALVVDDDEGVREILVDYLGDYEIQVVEAVDGESAWELLKTSGSEFDLVFSDLKMPGLSGEELVELIEQAEPLRDLGLILVTGGTAPANWESTPKTRFRASLVKPFNETTIQQVISDYHQFRSECQ